MKAKKICYFLLFWSLLIFIRCKQDENFIPFQPVGDLVSYEGCKSFAQESGASSQVSLFHAQNQDCIEYQYYGDSVLELHHINACFNCCPREIVAHIDINDNVIIIEESEAEQGCFCLCLFDVNYKIEGLQPGKYTIEIIEPYTNDQDEKLWFVLDLFHATSGTYCSYRSHLPWTQ
jgi:hypothetical protein